MTTAESWMLALNALMAVGTFGALIVAIIALNKKAAAQISPQPLAVEVVKAIHERFAGKAEFDEHARNNTARHTQLFARIEQVETGAREELKHEMEKVNEHLTFIRESIAEVKTELKIRNA